MINRVVLVGRLTRDVEVRKTTNGLSVASFTVACDRRQRRDAQNQQSADFISCVAWRQTADFLGQYARKGTLVGVEGRIQTRNYDGQDGRKVYVTEVLCDTVQLLESKSQSQNRDYNNSQVSDYPINDTNSFDTTSNDPFGNSDFDTGPSMDISSDDLPF